MNAARPNLFRQFIVLGFVLLAIGGITLWAIGQLGRVPGKHSVVYKLSGSASVVVATYTRADGSQTVPENVGLPWTQKENFSQPGTAILTAGNPTQTGNVRCELYVDGELWEQNEIKAPRDKLTCAGLVP